MTQANESKIARAVHTNPRTGLLTALSCLDVRPLIKGYFSAFARVVGAVMSSAFFCGE